MTTQSEALSRIRAFQNRFHDMGYGNRTYRLLCLAAFPIAVTPDLLYRLWNNFRGFFPNETAIERVAVVDVLLWPAWRETATDVFELDEDVRNELLIELQQLDKQRQKGESESDLMKELAQFLYQYTTQTTSITSGSLLQKAQLLGVQATLAPGLAARQVGAELAKHIEAGNEPEILRMRNLVGALASLHADFEPLLSVTKSLKAGLLGMPQSVWQRQVDKANEANGESVMSMAFGTDVAENEPYLVIPLLKEMEGQMTLPEHEGPKQPKRLFLLTIGIDAYEGSPLKGCVNDAELLSEVLPNYFRADNQEVIKKSLINEDATKTAILEAFKTHLSQAGPDDIVVFTFSGHGQNAQQKSPQNTIVMYGFPFQAKEDRIINPVDLINTTITETEFRELVHTAGKNDPHVLLITDTHNGSANWLNPINSKHIIMMAGSDWDYVYEDQYEGKSHGRFTAALVKALRSTRARAPQTYHRLIRQIYLTMPQSNRDQMPQLFGTEQAILRPFLSTDDSRMLYLRECLLQKKPTNSAEDEMAFHESFSLQSATDSILERYAGVNRVSSESLPLEDVLRLKQAMLVNGTEWGLSAISFGSHSGLEKAELLMTRLSDSLVSKKQINAIEVFYQER